MQLHSQRFTWFAPLAAIAIPLIGCSGAPPLPISLSLTSASKAIDQGVQLSIPITATVTNDTAASGVTWVLAGPGSLGTTSSTATYAPPTAALTSAQQATVTATSIADPTKTASLQITVNPYPAIPGQTLANGTVGVPYSNPIAIFGGTAPFHWEVYNGPIVTGHQVGGSVPDGLTMDPITGTIAGTPTAAGTWYFEATATDIDNAFGYDGFLSIQINPAGAATANAVPFLNRTLAPTAIHPGSGATTLNVGGAGFVAASTVHFDGTALATTFVDRDHLSSIVPAAALATAHSASVTVVTPAPGGGTSNVVYLPIGASHSTVSFVNAPNSPLAIPEAASLAIADFNQDGKPDLAVAANVRVYAMLSKGDGTFTAAPGSPVFLPSPPFGDLASPIAGPMAEGDFGNNGHLGLAVNMTVSHTAAIILGDGSGAFVPSSATFVSSSGLPGFAIETADFNGDGNLDLVTASGSFALAALGYGKGAFNSSQSLYNQAQVFPAGLTVGDFNQDGKLDAIVVSQGSSVYPDSGLTAWLGNGDGTFTLANGSPLALGQSLFAVVAADFNGDGKLDVAIADFSGGAVYILLGKGDGTFQQPAKIAVGNGPDAIVAGDFNNDGNLDLAIANYNDNTITLLLGSGDGTFTPASGSPFATGTGPTSLAAADFNGDGKLDLAVAAGNTVSILLQQ